MTRTGPQVTVPVHVTPRAARDEIAGWVAGELAVRVTAPPDEGRANATACRLLAKALGVPKTAVSVARGARSRHKLLGVAGLDAEEVAKTLGRPDGI